MLRKRIAAAWGAFLFLTGCTNVREQSSTDNSVPVVTTTQTTTTATTEPDWMTFLPYYLGDFRSESANGGFYHPVAMHLLESQPSADNETQAEEKTLFLGFQRIYDAEDCFGAIFEAGTGEIKRQVCAGAAHCADDAFWCASADGTVQIWNYQLERLQQISLPDCCVISADLTAERIYGVTESGAVVVCGYDGVLDSVCELDGVTVTDLHACAEELIFVGETEQGACCGRICLDDGSYILDVRADAGGYCLRGFAGGAIITDADRYDDAKYTGEIRYMKDGETRIIQTENACESACAFPLPSGDAILTGYQAFEESNSSVRGWISMYAAEDGRNMWSVWYAQTNTELPEMIQHGGAYLTERCDIDYMMFLDEIDVVWCECAYSMDRFSYTEQSIRNLSK